MTTTVLVSSPVLAQVETAGLDSITVTAQKRDENLQDVPVNVSVLSAEDIERKQITQIDDIEFATPNFALRTIGQRASTTLLFIRGLGNGFQTQTLRTTVVVDDVPLGNTRGLNSTLFDVEQIEVLKGPQSTLYGLTAEAGAVVVKTRKPGNDFQANLSGTVTNNDRRVMGSVSGPVIEDVFSLGVAAAYDEGDGFVDNALTGEDFDQSETLSGRVRAIITPNERVEFDLTYQFQEIDDDYGQSALPIDRAAFNEQFGLNIGDYETAQTAPGFNKVESHQVSLKGTYEADNFDIVSVTSYVDLVADVLFDIDLGPGLFFDFFESGGVDTKFDFFNQEIRVVSKNDGPFQWLIGGNYYDRNFDRDSIGTAPTPFGLTIVPRDAQRYNYESWSVFAQGSYDITDRATLTGGLRYESVDTTATTVSNGFADFFMSPKVPDGTTLTTNSDVILPRVAFDYSVTDNILAYASAARGWLPAGFNANQPSLDLWAFEKETLWNYEFGVKTDLFDNRLRVNASIYQIDIDNYQEQVRSDPLTFFVDNVEGVRIRGVDLDVTALVTDTIEIGGSLGYNDPKYTDFVDTFSDFFGGTLTIDNTDNRLPGAARVQANANVTWNFADDFYARADYVHGGDFRVIEDRTNELPVQSGYDILNLRIGYEGERLGAAFFVNNVTDERFDFLVLDQSGDGRLFGVPGEGIEVGGTLTVRY